MSDGSNFILFNPHFPIPGEKPYPCRFCGRRFRTNYNKLGHEKKCPDRHTAAAAAAANAAGAPDGAAASTSLPSQQTPGAAGGQSAAAETTTTGAAVAAFR